MEEEKIFLYIINNGLCLLGRDFETHIKDCMIVRFNYDRNLEIVPFGFPFNIKCLDIEKNKLIILQQLEDFQNKSKIIPHYLEVINEMRSSVVQPTSKIIY